MGERTAQHSTAADGPLAHWLAGSLTPCPCPVQHALLTPCPCAVTLTMAAPDALLISALADSILLVIELGRSSDAETDEVSRRLARTGKPICGAVVTKVTGSNIRSGIYGGYPGSRYSGASVVREPY